MLKFVPIQNYMTTEDVRPKCFLCYSCKGGSENRSAQNGNIDVSNKKEHPIRTIIPSVRMLWCFAWGAC